MPLETISSNAIQCLCPLQLSQLLDGGSSVYDNEDPAGLIVFSFFKNCLSEASVKFLFVCLLL